MLPAIPTTTSATLPAVAAPISADLVEMLLAGLSVQSRAGYRKDLAALARFLELPTAAEAVARVLSLHRAEANVVAASWIYDQTNKGISPATVRRRYAAYARIYSAGRRFGLTSVFPEAELPHSEPLRDTAGPGKRGWERMLATARLEADTRMPAAVRNLAIVVLMHDRGLRRGEVAALDWPADVDLAGARVAILGKGKTEKVWLTVSDRARDAVADWIRARGDAAGPLFTRLDPAAQSCKRLMGQGINAMVGALAKRAGLSRNVVAHGLRHQAVTEALDKGWSIRDVMSFSRHVNPATLMLYDDRRKDVAGDVSRSLAEEKRAPRRR